MMSSIDNVMNLDFGGMFQQVQSPISVTFQGLRSTIYNSPAKIKYLVKKTLKPQKRKATFPPIENETRSHVNTACAAFWLSREEQTLRSWASLENGKIRPIRVNGRLAWPVAKIKEVLGIN